jgi:hypothetical protein
VGLPGGVTGAVGCGYSPGEWRRGERVVGEDLGKIWGMHGLGPFSLSLSFLKYSNNAIAGAFPSVVLASNAW